MPDLRLFIYELICAGALPLPAASLRREGWAMLSAIAEDFAHIAHVDTLLAEGDLPAVGSRCQRVTPDAEPAAFQTLAARADATLVIAPECDGLLEERTCWVLEVGGRLLGSAPAAIRLTADKLALAHHWSQRAIPTPPTWLAGDESPPCPAVCKPRVGAGSQATFLVRDPDEWPVVQRMSREDWTGERIVQPYVAGLPASVVLLIGPRGAVPLVPAAQTLSSDGRFRYLGGRLPLPAPLAQRAQDLACRAVAGIDGLRGYVGVDLVLGEAGDWAIEINPRLTTSYLGLRQLCRQNLAAAWLGVERGDVVEVAWRTEEVRFGAG